MPSFESPVNAPSTRDYAPPVVDFSILGNLYNTAQQSGLNDQEKQLRALALQKQQQDLAQQQQVREALANIKPDAQGNVNYPAIQQVLAKFGDIGGLTQLQPAAQAQQAGAVSPLLTGGPAPSAAAPPGPRGDIPPASAAGGTRTTPSGDSVTSIVATTYDGTPAQAEALRNRIATTMGVEPGATLTPGQRIRAQGLLTRYSGTTEAPAGNTLPTPAAVTPGAPLAAPVAPNARVAEGFAPVPPAPGLPPAGAPGPQSSQTAPVPSASPPTAQPAPAASPTPPVAAAGVSSQGQPQGPIVPQVPLPKGFNDPMTAIQALRTEAARLSANPYAAGQVKALNDWATRIESAQQPLTVSPGQRIVSPTTGQTVYSAPERPVSVGGQLVRPDTGEVVFRPDSGSQATLDADAETYRQTGKLPPNMGRGIQGQQQSQAIRTRAVEHEVNAGGDPSTWPARWQGFATHAAGLRALETRAANLTLVEEETKTLIPRVREASAKVSRTEYPNLNAIILAAQKGTGGQNVIKFGVAVESLIPVYARLLKPTGQIGVTDTQNARHILDKAWSDGQIGAALDQMEVERKAAKDALAEARKSFASPTGGSRETATAAEPAKPVKWEKGPDGVLRPAQ